ncbi:MAG: hypothetical protein ABI811_14465 [Acidobacteriota bacterium]
MALVSSASALGLDVGTSRLVVARQTGDEIRYESQLNAFVTIPNSKITEGALKREHVPHSVLGNEIIVQGNESEKFASLLNAEIRRPMTRGVLDARESSSLQVIRELLVNLLGYRDPFRERKVTFTVPAAPLGAEGSLTFHEKTLRQILNDLGYEATSINEGLAVVYSELESSNYTGIGISCGGGLCNVCLAYLSVPVLSFSVPKAGDFIDLSAAQVSGERANRIRLTKEDSFHFNGFFSDKIHQVISVYYEDVIQNLVKSLKEAFERTGNLPKFSRPIPLVLSGGTAMPTGFRDRFEQLLSQQDFPVTVSEVRMASNPLYSTAKGALAAALSDS